VANDKKDTSIMDALKIQQEMDKEKKSKQGESMGAGKDAASGIMGLLKLAPAVAAFLAKGGKVNRGKVYVVGEKGPELFVPKKDGKVVSNKKAKKMVAKAKAKKKGK